MTTIVHVVNQFFAGLGGEDRADMPVGVIEGSAGAARGLQLQLGEEAKIASTIYYGDNYFHEHKEDALKAILEAVRSAQPQALVAGPAFNSGRYGVSCVEVCNAIANALGISCVTAMHQENPGIGTYLDFANTRVYCLPAAETTAGMNDALSAWPNLRSVSLTMKPSVLHSKKVTSPAVSDVWSKRIVPEQSAPLRCCSRK